MSVKENDLLGYWFPTNWALDDLVSTQLAGAVATQEDAVLPAIHAHLTLGLREEREEGEGEGEGGRERGRGRGREGGEREVTLNIKTKHYSFSMPERKKKILMSFK